MNHPFPVPLSASSKQNRELLFRIIRMKHQRPNLNTLPRHSLHKLLINKRTMRHPPRPPIRLTIKALNQRNLARTLLKQIMPLMTSRALLTRPHSISLSSPMRIDQFNRYEFIIRDGIGGCDAQGVFQNRFDGSPDVDYLEAAFQKSGGFVGEVVGYAVRGGGVGLVDVHPLDRTAAGLWDWNCDGPIACGWWLGRSLGLCCGWDGLAAGVNRLATDGVVEDEDLGGAGAGVLVSQVRDVHTSHGLTLSSRALQSQDNKLV